MGLVAWWPLNGDLKDASSSHKDGAPLGILPLDNSGKMGKTYLFQNNDNGVNIANNNFAGLKEYTMCAWIYPMGNHRNYNGTVISSGNWNGKAWAFGVSQNNTQIDVAGRGYNKYINYNVPVNQWTHILCIVKDGVSKLYVNGNYIGQKNVTAELWSDATNTCLGRETYAGGHFSFNGKINDVRIYDNAISVKEAKEIAKCKILHYDFNEYKQSAINKFSTAQQQFIGWNKYQGALVEITQNQIIPEWNTTKATKIKTTGGTSVVKYYLSLMSNQNGGRICSSSVKVKNIGNTRCRISTQYGSVILNPGEISHFKNVGTIVQNGSNYQFHFESLTPTEDIEVIAYEPMWEDNGNCSNFTTGTREDYISDNSSLCNHSNPMSITQTPLWKEDGVLGTGCYYFKSDALVTTPFKINNNNVAKPWSQMSISCWIKLNSHAMNGVGCIVGMAYYGGLGIGISSNGTSTTSIGVYFRNSVSHYSTTNRNIDLNKWYHCVAMVDNPSSKIRFYLNGEKIYETSITTGDLGYENRDFCINASQQPGGNGPWATMDGCIDDVRIYATALSDEDIRSLYGVRGSISKKGELFIDEIKEDIDNTILTIDDITIGNLTATGVNFSAADDNGIRTLTNTGNSGTYRLNMPLDKLTYYNGETLTMSFKYAFDGGSESDFYFTDWCDTSIVKQTSGGKMYCQGSYGTYTSTFRFIDGQINSGTKVRIWDLKLTRGTIPKYKATVTKKGQLETIEVLENTFKPTCVDYSKWTKSSAPGWGNNGSASENTRVVHPNPVGDMDIMWATLTNDAASDGDGGFVSPTFAIDRTKKYRYSIWIRRENCGGGRTYFGCYGYDASSANGHVLNLSNSAANTNPYFTSFLKNEFGGATDNKWALLVAYIHPHTYTGTSSDPTNGVYSLKGIRMGGVTDYKWSSTATQAKTRSYLYYSVDVNERQYFYRPRVEVCDGSEPSIQELLTCSEHIPLTAIVERPNPIGVFSLGKNGQTYATNFIEST